LPSRFVRPHLNLTVIDALANDIIGACQFLEKHGGTATAPQLHGHDRSAPKC
jgi:glutamate decarboxylase